MDNYSSAIDAINAASSQLAASAGLITGVGESKNARKWQEKMYDIQRQDVLSDIADARSYAERIWNMENEYNLPVNQMARMTAAGINPNNAAPAIAGVQTSAAAPQPVTPNNVSVGSPSFSNISASMLEAARVQKELSKTEAEIENIKADTAQKDANTQHTYVDMNKLSTEIQGLIFDNQILKPAEANELWSTYQKNMASKVVDEEQAKVLRESTRKIQEDIKNAQKEREEIQARIALLKKQEQTEDVKQDLMSAQKALEDVNTHERELFNQYEETLQGLGTSTHASGNPIINQRDQASVIASRAASGGQKGSSAGVTNSSSSTPNQFHDVPLKKAKRWIHRYWHSVKSQSRDEFNLDFKYGTRRHMSTSY